MRSAALSKKSAWMHGSCGTAASVLSSPSGRSGFGIKLRSKRPTTSTTSVVRSCSALSTSASLSSAVMLGCSGIGVRSEACAFLSSPWIAILPRAAATSSSLWPASSWCAHGDSPGTDTPNSARRSAIFPGAAASTASSPSYRASAPYRPQTGCLFACNVPKNSSQPSCVSHSTYASILHHAPPADEHAISAPLGALRPFQQRVYIVHVEQWDLGECVDVRACAAPCHERGAGSAPRHARPSPEYCRIQLH